MKIVLVERRGGCIIRTQTKQTMKFIKIHPAITLLIAVIVCGLIEDAPAASRVKGEAITNATKAGMPIARKQRIETSRGTSFIYTAIAKKGYCFAVKSGRIAYMSNERAAKLGVRTFSMSHKARTFAKTYTK